MEGIFPLQKSTSFNFHNKSTKMRIIEVDEKIHKIYEENMEKYRNKIILSPIQAKQKRNSYSSPIAYNAKNKITNPNLKPEVDILNSKQTRSHTSNHNEKNENPLNSFSELSKDQQKPPNKKTNENQKLSESTKNERRGKNEEKSEAFLHTPFLNQPRNSFCTKLERNQKLRGCSIGEKGKQCLKSTEGKPGLFHTLETKPKSNTQHIALPRTDPTNSTPYTKHKHFPLTNSPLKPSIPQHTNTHSQTTHSQTTPQHILHPSRPSHNELRRKGRNSLSHAKYSNPRSLIQSNSKNSANMSIHSSSKVYTNTKPHLATSISVIQSPNPLPPVLNYTNLGNYGNQVPIHATHKASSSAIRTGPASQILHRKRQSREIGIKAIEQRLRREMLARINKILKVISIQRAFKKWFRKRKSAALLISVTFKHKLRMKKQIAKLTQLIARGRISNWLSFVVKKRRMMKSVRMRGFRGLKYFSHFMFISKIVRIQRFIRGFLCRSRFWKIRKENKNIITYNRARYLRTKRRFELFYFKRMCNLSSLLLESQLFSVNVKLLLEIASLENYWKAQAESFTQRLEQYLFKISNMITESYNPYDWYLFFS